MFTFINKYLRSIRAANGSSCKEKGQVAIILIFVIAFALIFYAVVLNLGKLSETKTLTQIASNIGAAQLASQMASYGQAVFEQSLGGERKICGWTGVLATIVAFIVAIIIIYFTWGEGTPVALAIVAIALSFAAVVIQLVFIQPGLTSLWNKIEQETLSISGRFVESGIANGLRNVVTDRTLIADMTDLDVDTIWGGTLANPNDKVSRFAHYYTERLLTSVPIKVPEVGVFQDALENFLFDKGDGFGLFDPLPTCPASSECCYSPGAVMPSECNPCCVPRIDPLSGQQLRPTCCDAPDDSICGTVDTCISESPYGAPKTDGNVYQYVYDPFYEDNLNFFRSFRENIGRDDEHWAYVKQPPPGDPNENQLPEPPPAPPFFVVSGKTFQNPPNDNVGRMSLFRLDDATGFYTPPVHSPATDNRAGIFPFFYKIADWGVDLDNLDVTDTWNPECFWCDPRDTSSLGCVACAASQPAEIPQLALPLDPSDPVGSGLCFNTNGFVEGTGLPQPAIAASCIAPHVAGDGPASGQNAFSPDKVKIPDGTSGLGILAEDTDCAQDILTTPPEQGFWKRGADRFCDDGALPIINGIDLTWPYGAECAKHAVCPDQVCDCAEAVTFGGNPIDWPEDVIDDIVYGLTEFIPWAQWLISFSSKALELDFESWYGDSIVWLEPPLGAAPCFNCDPTNPGFLYVFRDEIKAIHDRLLALRETSFEADVSQPCSEVWCVPNETLPPGVCAQLNPDEELTFDFNGNLIRGDIEDVVQCLDWNVNDTITTTSGIATGNFEKFRLCRRTCSDETCNNLPRSIIPPGQYEPQDYLPGDPLDEGDIQAMLDCMDTCSVATCSLLPLQQASTLPPDPGPPVDYTWPAAPSTFAAAECATWSPGNAWFDRIVANLIIAGPSCDLRQGEWLTQTGQSAAEALNQVEKFRVRLEFLKERLTELDNIINIFQEAHTKFTEFIDGPVRDLIDARINFDPSGGDLPLQAVYAWQTPVPKDPPPGRTEGYWHIVKVEARTPGRCFNSCGPGGGRDPLWPRVITYTKAWGQKRCYELSDTDGMVKVRVIRFDEDRDTNILRFPNGMPIWDFRFARPDRDEDLGDLSGLATDCAKQVAYDPGETCVGSGTQDLYRGAFMLNKLVDSTVPPICPGGGCPVDSCVDNSACWNRVHKALAAGTVTETCARYYYHDGSREGFGLQFVDCPAEWP